MIQQTSLFITLVLVVHWLGDYILQMPFKYNGKPLAIEKTRNSEATYLHVLIYSLCYLPICMYYCKQYLIIPFLVIGTTHFLEDRYNFPLKFYKNRLKEMQASENIETKIWAPVLYVMIDNGYHIIVNLIILIIFMKG